MYDLQRKAIESLYIGKCTISTVQDVKDPNTNLTEQKEVIIVKDEPCRLSYSTVTISTMVSNSDVDTVRQTIKVFIRPELNIPAGSRFLIEQHGKKNYYRNSGFPAVYTSHQEIPLELEDKFGRYYE